MKIPNVSVPDAQVPATFLEQAARLKFTTVALLWMLAEDFCANPPRSLEVVKVPPKPTNIVAFPSGEGEPE